MRVLLFVTTYLFIFISCSNNNQEGHYYSEHLYDNMMKYEYYDKDSNLIYLQEVDTITWIPQYEEIYYDNNKWSTKIYDGNGNCFSCADYKNNDSTYTNRYYSNGFRYTLNYTNAIESGIWTYEDDSTLVKLYFKYCPKKPIILDSSSREKIKEYLFLFELLSSEIKTSPRVIDIYWPNEKYIHKRIMLNKGGNIESESILFSEAQLDSLHNYEYNQVILDPDMDNLETFDISKLQCN